MVANIKDKRARDASLRKVFFDLGDDEWHGRSSESLWAEHISGSKFKLRNSPFFAKGISFEDIVEVKEEDGRFIFVRSLIASGNSTYRLLVEESKIPNPFMTHWTPLEKLGCSYEESDELALRMYAVDVPSNTDIYAAYRLLEAGKNDGLWDFEAGHCGHILDGR